MAWRAASAEPRVEVRFVEYATNQNARVAVVAIRNAGSAPVLYRGYAKAAPACEFEQRMADGAWNPRISFCGTGLFEQVLGAGEEIRGEVWVRGDANWRAGLRYRKADLIDWLPAPLQARMLGIVSKRPQARVAWAGEMEGFPAEE